LPRLFGSKGDAAISSTVAPSPDRPSPVRVSAKLSVPTGLPPEVLSMGGRDIRLSGRCGVVETVTLFPQSLNGFIDTVLRQKPKVTVLHTQKIRLSVQNIRLSGGSGENGADKEASKRKLTLAQRHWDVLRKHVMCGGREGPFDSGASDGKGGSSVSSEDGDAEDLAEAARMRAYLKVSPTSRRPSICQ